MQREVINGVPFLCDKSNKLYVFEPNAVPGTPLFHIGTKKGDGYELLPNWEQSFQQHLTTWRQGLKPHSRKPAPKNTPASTSR
jgi:hypothetical protein